MLKAKIFENGRSQAVRLPKECRFNSDTNEVSVNKIGDIVMLIPMTNQWSSFIQATCFRPFASDCYTLKYFTIFTYNGFWMYHTTNPSMVKNCPITYFGINRY